MNAGRCAVETHGLGLAHGGGLSSGLIPVIDTVGSADLRPRIWAGLWLWWAGSLILTIEFPSGKNWMQR